jgi:radical SAM superfamily enzyme YgiQ (UPF0313 family)
MDSVGATSHSLAGARILLVFHSFKEDKDTLAFVKNVRHLGVIPPMNLLWTSAWLKRHGAQTMILDCSALNIGLEQALERAAHMSFDAVGFTATNLDFLFVSDWIRAFSRRFGKPVMVGGIGAENYPAEVAAHPEIAVAFTGPSEMAVAQWLEAHLNGGDTSSIPGTAVRHEGGVRVNPPAPLPDGFVRPFPDREGTDIRSYFSILAKGFPSTAGMSSFGCPFGCEFCQLRRTHFIVRSAEDMIDELEHCERELGIEEIDYFDSNFTVPRARALEFAELYRKRGLRIRWSARVRADLADDELLRELRRVNCAWIGYGIESGSDDVLRAIKKTQRGTTNIMSTLRRTKAAGIGTTGFFVMGLPGETDETIRTTLEFIEAAPLDFVQISPYWPIPNTPPYERIVRETGIDVWRDAIVHGRRRTDMPLTDTRFSVRDMHATTARLYREFYFRPSQLLNLASNAASFGQFKRFVSAGMDVLTSAVEAQAPRAARLVGLGRSIEQRVS